MEPQTENPPSSQNSFENFLHQFEKMDHWWSEFGWPIGSLIFQLRPLHHWLIGHVAKIEQGQRVLEIGAGYPLYKLYADKVGKDGLFAAIDINQGIQRRAKKICYWIDNFFKKDSGDHREVAHAVADATKLPFEDNSFDTVIASNFTGGDANYGEVYRTLKPGGRVIYTWNEVLLVPIVTAEQANICKKIGFERVKIRPGTPGSIVPWVAWNWYMEATKPIPPK